MKKLLLVCLLCLIPFLSFASGPAVLATGTCTRDNMRLSTIAGTAFWQCNGVDISAFAGEYIELRDTANKVLRGFAKAAGGGLAYGSDKDVDGITKANPGVVTLAASSAITDGMCVYFSGLAEMTDLNTKYRTVKGTSGDTFQLESTSGYAAAETTGGNCLKQLTVPAATGVTIVSTNGGTTYNWAFTESGFNVNDSSYTYRILSTNIPGKQIASGTVSATDVKLATVDGGAMVEITGVDLSPYAGVDSYSPPSTNLQLHLKADAGCFTDAGKTTACASDADKVYVWEDQSGNGNDAVQATEGYRPLWKTNIVGSLPAIRFDGSNDYMDTALSGTQPITFFVVRSVSTSGSTFDSTNANRITLFNSGDSSQMYAGSTARIDTTAGIKLFTLTYNGASSEAYVFGRKKIGINPSTNSLGALRLGADNALNAASFITGDIYELLVYTGIPNDVTRTQIERYLAGKWGITYTPTVYGTSPAKYLLALYDSSGRVATGYVGAAGGGESLGTEIATGTLTAGKLYKITATEANHFYTGCAIGEYFTSVGTETCDASNKVQEVTEVEATGLHGHSTANGTDRKMSLKTTGFDPNTVTKYKIYRVY
jgi:hypothetical protein